MNQTADGVEAESARVRSELQTIGKDLRRHADPAGVIDAAKSSFKRRASDAPSYLKRNATPIGMTLMGVTIGAALTGMLSSQRTPLPVLDTMSVADRETKKPSARAQVKAALLSGTGLTLGAVASMFIPQTPTEERLIGEPKAILSKRLDQLFKQHAEGMKLATARLFGISRMSAVTLVGLTVVADVLGGQRKSARVRP